MFSKDQYLKEQPYPHAVVDNFLSSQDSYELRECITSIPCTEFDLYNNPFENKLTLKDKWKLPPKLGWFFNYVNSIAFIQKISDLTGIDYLFPDVYRYYWGVHIANKGSYLHPHLDAKIHPKCLLEKKVTLLFYMTFNKQTQGLLELWDKSMDTIVKKIEPKHNRLVIFTNTEESYHGFSTITEDATRILVTVSYLGVPNKNIPQRFKAKFVAPYNIDDGLEDLRKKRMSVNDCTKIYNMNIN